MPPLSEYLIYFAGAVIVGYLAWLLIRRLINYLSRRADRRIAAVVERYEQAKRADEPAVRPQARALVDGRWVDINDAADESVTEDIPLVVDQDVTRPYVPVRQGRRELCRTCIEAYADRRRDGVCDECAPVMYGMAR